MTLAALFKTETAELAELAALRCGVDPMVTLAVLYKAESAVVRC